MFYEFFPSLLHKSVLDDLKKVREASTVDAEAVLSKSCLQVPGASQKGATQRNCELEQAFQKMESSFATACAARFEMHSFLAPRCRPRVS